MSSAIQPVSISVVIPVFGCGHFLSRALGSVARQTTPPREVIVVDDASPTAISVETSANDPFPFTLRIERLMRNGGAAVARNAGAALASSEIVAFLDADDAMRPDYLEFIGRQWQRASQEVGLLAVGFHWCDANLTPYRLQAVSAETQITAASLLKLGNFVGGCSVLSVRAGAFGDVGGFPPMRSCQDWALMLAIAQKYRLYALPKPCVLYTSPTFNPTSMTKNTRRAILGVCTIYRLFDTPGRGRAYPIKASLIAYHLVRAKRTVLALRVVQYCVLRYRRVDRLLLKAAYEWAAPQSLQAVVRRMRTVARTPAA